MMRTSVITLILPLATVIAEPVFAQRDPGFQLPKGAEALLLSRVPASRIVDIQEVVYQRKNDGDYLAVAASFEVSWSFESWYHHSYVLKKPRGAATWDGAIVYGWEVQSVAVPPELQSLYGPSIRVHAGTILQMPLALMKDILVEVDPPPANKALQRTPASGRR